MITFQVSAADLLPGDNLGNGAIIKRTWVATNPLYIMAEFEGGGIRTYYRYRKFTITREQ